MSPSKLTSLFRISSAFIVGVILTFLLVNISHVGRTVAQERPALSADAKLERANALRDGQLTLPGQVAAAPKAPDELGSAALRMFQGLGLVVGLLLIGAWAYKKYVLKDTLIPNRRIKILERLMLGPRNSLLLVEVDSQKVLVGMAPSQITLLHISGENNVAKEINTTKDFAITLSEELK